MASIDMELDPATGLLRYSGAANYSPTTQAADWIVVADGATGTACGYSPVFSKAGLSGLGRRLDIAGGKVYTAGGLSGKGFVGIINAANCKPSCVTTCIADAVLQVSDSTGATEFRDVKVVGSYIYAAGFREVSAPSYQAAVWKLDMSGNIVKKFYHPQSGGFGTFNGVSADGAGNIYVGGLEKYDGTGTGDAIGYKLSGELTEVWKVQNVTSGTDVFNNVLVGGDGSVFFGGTENGSSMVVNKCDPAGNCGK